MSVNEVKIKRAANAFELRGTGPDTSRTFVLGDEDHTLGNALRHVLINDARVDFAGYCVPHPSEPVVHLRVQSNTAPRGVGRAGGSVRGRDRDEEITDNYDGRPLTAIEALKEACATLASQCDMVLEKLMEAAPEVKEDMERMERFAEEDRMNEGEEEEGGGEEEYDDE
jgi:DNA-directed RNA polymerase I and III subunit RPAC2